MLMRNRLGGTVDENRNGVPLALPVHWGVVWIFVDERYSPEPGSAVQECTTASIPICRCYATLIMNGFTPPV